MPFLVVVHLRELDCGQCGARLAEAGARSFIVDADGDPILFDDRDQPAEMVVEMRCPRGHLSTLMIPNEVSAEETLTMPESAPIAADARMRSGKSESGKAL